jgi:hypothetical protein
MADRDIAAFGLFPDRASLERAVNLLRGAGFRNSDVSMLMQETPTKDLAHEAHTKAPEGATAGAAAGAVVGGITGWLIGIGVLAIPGIGPFIAAGPIVAALAGIGAAGTAGGLIGALVGVGIPEYEAKRYEGRLRKGTPSAVRALRRLKVGEEGDRFDEAGWRRGCEKHGRSPCGLSPVSRTLTGCGSDNCATSIACARIACARRLPQVHRPAGEATPAPESDLVRYVRSCGSRT